MWVGTDRANVVTQSLQADVLAGPLAHSYISKAQSMYLMNQKESRASDTCIMMLDFAENYQYVLQDDIQSFHLNSSQCNIHPAVIILKTCQISFKRSHLLLYQKI